MVHYDHPRPALAVDIALFRRQGEIPHILLIQRAKSPFQGQCALPGGFVEMEESLLAAARRELREETGIKNIDLTQVRAFGEPHRDPRGHVVSVLFTGILSSQHPSGLQAASDASQAGWHPVHDLPELAFDHEQMITAALQAAGFPTGRERNTT